MDALRTDWTRVDLADGEARSASAGEGTRVIALSGHVWITQAGEDRDVTLSAGDSVVLASNGDTVIEALDGPATVLLEPAVDEQPGPDGIRGLLARIETAIERQASGRIWGL